MKNSSTITARKIRQALASGIVLSAGVSSLLHAQQAEKGKEWLQKMSSRNGNKPAKTIKARVQDALHGNSGNDLMMRSIPGCATTGTTGNDTIALGGTYCDTAFGLAGEDLFYGYSTSPTDTLIADGGSGADNIQIYSYGPVIGYGGSEDDIALLYTYADVFGDGGDGNDTFTGYGYYGDVILVGDLGNDVLTARTYASVYVDAGDGTDEVEALCLYGPAVTTGGMNADNLVSGSYYGDNSMFGGDGSDYMYGASVTGVRNFMDGGQGDDIMAVGVYYTYAGYGTAYTYAGSYLYGGPGNDAMLAHVGNDTLVGGPGTDVMRAYGGDDLLVASSSTFALADGGPGTDLLETDFDFTLSTAILAMERIDFGGTAARTLSISGSLVVHNTTAGTNSLTSSDSTLVIDGEADDNVALAGAYTMTGSGTIGSNDYNIYETPDLAILWINKNVNVILAGVDGNALEEGLSVGPVPTDGLLNVNVLVPVSGTLDLRVTDLTGKALYQEQRLVVQGSYKGSLDVTAFPAGVYLLEVGLGDARSTRKIVVQ